jgi:hypothetical protein
MTWIQTYPMSRVIWTNVIEPPPTQCNLMPLSGSGTYCGEIYEFSRFDVE